MSNNLQNREYIIALDGLRALAMIFIIGYHFSFGWASGGFLGVDVFFVLSGYLMTSKIFTLQENGFKCSLRKLWSRRIQRLMPVLYTMIAATFAWLILFNREVISKILGDAVSSLFYATNWWFIFHKLSYFESFGTPSPLKHLWFLAVQEQFFFIWSIVLIIGLRYFKKREMLFIITLICALCSSLLMGIMYQPGADPSRVYYGTDTRSFELLIGSLLAFVVSKQKSSSREISITKRNMLNIMGLAALAVFIFSAVLVDEYQVFLYRGGMFLFSLNAVLLIFCISHPASFTGNILSWEPLRWIGTRAYGMYLWHYPIIVLSTPVYEIGNPAYWRVLLQLAVTCIIAELTYRYVEKPIRSFGIKEYFRKYGAIIIFKWRELTSAKRISAVIAVFLIIVLAVNIKYFVSAENKAAEGVSISQSKTVNPLECNETDSPGNNADSNVDKKLNLTEDEQTDSIESNREDTSQIKPYQEILAIGDSVLLDIASMLKERYDNISIDGKVSRQMTDAIKLIPDYEEFNCSDKAVIIELGTNGYFTDKQIDSLLDSFSHARIFLVNTRVPRTWERKVNKILEQKAVERENVTLVDWYSVAIEHPEYFGSDGVHLKAKGAEALTDLICEALNKNK